MATKGKKPRKVSPYHRRLGAALKKGKTFKQAHAEARKGGKPKRRRARRARKAVRRTARRAKAKAKAGARTVAKYKFPIFTGLALGVPIVTSVLKSGLDSGEVTRDKILTFVRHYISCYMPILVHPDGNAFWYWGNLVDGWGPLLGLGGLKFFKKMIGFRSPKGLPVSPT